MNASRTRALRCRSRLSPLSGASLRPPDGAGRCCGVVRFRARARRQIRARSSAIAWPSVSTAVLVSRTHCDGPAYEPESRPTSLSRLTESLTGTSDAELRCTSCHRTTCPRTARDGASRGGWHALRAEGGGGARARPKRLLRCARAPPSVVGCLHCAWVGLAEHSCGWAVHPGLPRYVSSCPQPTSELTVACSRRSLMVARWLVLAVLALHCASTSAPPPPPPPTLNSACLALPGQINTVSSTGQQLCIDSSPQTEANWNGPNF